MFTKKEKITITNYNKFATKWTAAHAETDIFDNAFPKFRKYLPKGKILEIGFGGGRDAKKLEEAGYEYVGVDVSTGFLKEARKNNPNLTFLLQDVYQLNFSFLFDGFWCAATLLHIPKSRINKALKNIHKIIKPNGIGFICIKEGKGDLIAKKKEIEGQIMKTYFSYYQQDEFSQILTSNKFSILKTSRRPVSIKTTWLNFFVKIEK